jgi:precorrin-8X/cobalt-precorrin-8 methylmutase
MELRPDAIEARSFALIEELLAGRTLDAANAPVIKRCIHASADPDYADMLYFSPGAVLRMRAALRRGCTLITDTRMARAGINKPAARALGIRIACCIADADVAAAAAAAESTRAAAAVAKAVRLPGPHLFAVGNAPTALLALDQAVREGRCLPLGIVAAPVGFVNVVEAKEAIIETAAAYDIPCIAVRGRKGGSAIAAAVCNALLGDSRD